MKKIKFIIGLCLMSLIVSCACPTVEACPPDKPKDPVVVSPVYSFKWKNKEYTKYLVDELKTSELIKLQPKDKKDFGIKLDPILYWGNILVEMAKWESNWKPSAKYKESFGVWSRGLFQLSKVDGKRYGCDFTTEASVHNAKANIECSVKVMQKLVKQNGRIAGRVLGKWQGGARYWSVLRGTRTYTAKAFKAIKAANN